MNRKLAKDFLEKLIQTTLDKKIVWHPFSQAYFESNINTFGGDNFTIFQSEWHQIVFEKSYYAPVLSGFAYLLYEKNESGKDGSITDRLRLYVRESENAEVVPLDILEENLYRLHFSIMENLDKGPSDFMRKFIETE